MTCDEFEYQLHEVLDRRELLTDDASLSAHAEVCGACRRKLRLYESLFAGLELAETPALAEDFGQQITRAAGTRAGFAYKPLLAGAVALAASLLLMVAVSSRPASDKLPVEVEGSLAENPAATMPPRTTSDSVQQRHPPAMPGPTVALTALPPTAEGQSAALDEARLGSSPRELDELIKELQLASQNLSIAETSAATTRLPGFRPFASSVTTAFSALRQTLPGGRGDESQPAAKPQAGYQRVIDSRHA